MENEKNPFMSPFPPKGRGRQNHLYRAGGELPLLPQRLRCGGGRLRLPATLHCRDASGMPSRSGRIEDYKRMAYEQFTRLGKKAYPVLCSSPKRRLQRLTDYSPPDTCRILCFRPARHGEQRGRDKLPCRHGLHFHPHFSRQGGAGKQPVVRNGYPKAIGEE